MTNFANDNLISELSTLGKSASLSLTQRQKIRDRLFKKMGQVDLIDAVQTHTEVSGLVMSLRQLQTLFRPQRVSFSLPATAGMVMAVFLVTFTTGALAQTAQPGDPLFGVRRALENIQVAMTSEPSRKAEVQLAIVNDRLNALQTAKATAATSNTSKASKKLTATLEESQKAIDSAKVAINQLAASNSDPTTDDATFDKLKDLVDTQKAALNTITKTTAQDPEVQETLLAMRDQLNGLIDDAATALGTDAEDLNPTVESPDILTGRLLIEKDGQVVIYSNDHSYALVGVPINFSEHDGALVRVEGTLNARGITAERLYLYINSDNQLVWEEGATVLTAVPVTPSKDNNDLSRVEGDQNLSPR